MKSNTVQLMPMIAAILLTTTTLFGAVELFAGTSDRGGGNGTRSTVDEVEEGIYFLKKRLEEICLRMENVHLNKSKVASWLTPAMTDLVKDLDTQSLIQKIVVKPVKADCYDPQTRLPTDASITSSGEMCLSLTRLQRYPKYALKTEILALATHELSHLKGFSEAKAEKLQNDVLGSIEVLTAPLYKFPETMMSRKMAKVIGGRTMVAEFSAHDYAYNHSDPRQNCAPKIGMKVTFASYVLWGAVWRDTFGEVTKVNTDGSIEVSYTMGSNLISNGAILNCLDLK